MVACPECESDLDIAEDEVDEGEVVSCPAPNRNRARHDSVSKSGAEAWLAQHGETDETSGLVGVQG